MNVFAYWGARTGIFLVVLVVLWSVGWRDIIAVIAAVVVGGLVSYLALPNMRERAKVQMDRWVSRSHERQHSEDAVEDGEVAGASHAGTTADTRSAPKGGSFLNGGAVLDDGTVKADGDRERPSSS